MPKSKGRGVVGKIAPFMSLDGILDIDLLRYFVLTYMKRKKSVENALTLAPQKEGRI